MTYQLTYISEPFPWINIEDINDILQISRTFNAENQLTGCLIYTKKLFMQILEGDQEIIEGLYERIEKDRRHFNVELINTQHVDERVFSKWTMAYLNLKEQSSVPTIGKIKQNLLLLSEGASVTEIDLDKFWGDVHEALKDVGYYPNDTAEKI